MRKIIHIDMDCFYAAVEVKYRPELKGKPLGVGGPANSRSVLTTASYEARKFGVRSAMPSSQAVRLCPDLILVPPNFNLYKKESRVVREILGRFTDKIQPLSLDEAYLDVSNSPYFEGSATRIAFEIRKAIFQELNLTASAGVAENKFLAKIASDWKKPNGQFVIRPEMVAEFMPPLKVEKIWGVGKVTAKRMHELGLHTCGDIQSHSVAQLRKWFGSRAEDLYNLSHGIDHREVHERAERKSLSVEETYREDLADLGACLERIPELFEDWERRMSRAEARDDLRGIVVKLKFYDFKTTTHEKAMRTWPSLVDFQELLTKAWQRRGDPVRLIGIGARLTGDEPEEDISQLQFEL